MALGNAIAVKLSAEIVKMTLMPRWPSHTNVGRKAGKVPPQSIHKKASDKKNPITKIPNHPMQEIASVEYFFDLFVHAKTARTLAIALLVIAAEV